MSFSVSQYLALVSSIILITPCNSEAPAHVQSQYGQLVTSSTLTWVRSGLGQALPPGAVSSGTGDGVMCRGHVNGVLSPGYTSRSRCMVAGTAGKLIKMTQYFVLTHVASASKLKWISYERFNAVPQGAVAGLEGDDNVFLGRVLDGGVMRTAFIEIGSMKTGSFGGQIAVYSVDDNVHLVSSCDILIEVEPVSYQLDIGPYDKKPKTETKTVVLASSSMFRFEEGQSKIARMTKMVSYKYEKSLYFGHIKGVIKGLPTKIKMATGETKSIIWGKTDTDKQTESIMVEYNMNKNTAVDTEIRADQVSEEQSWSGLLVAVFSDGSRRERLVTGVTLTTYLDMIQPVYSNPHNIKQQYADTSLTTELTNSTIIHNMVNLQNLQNVQQNFNDSLQFTNSLNLNSNSINYSSKIFISKLIYITCITKFL